MDSVHSFAPNRSSSSPKKKVSNVTSEEPLSQTPIFKPKDDLAAFGAELDSQPSEEEEGNVDMSLGRDMGSTLNVDAHLDREENINSNSADSLVDTTAARSKKGASVPRHVALSSVGEPDLSPISGGTSSPETSEIPLNAHISRVSFLSEKAFSADNTDSSSSVDGEEEDATVGTLDSDALSSLDVSVEHGIGIGRTMNNMRHNLTNDEAGEVTAGLTRALQTSAVELCVEVRNFVRSSSMSMTPCSIFVVLFVQGSSPGSWEELDRTEGVINPRGNMRWVHKMRLPAATTLDRSEHIALGLFEDSSTSTSTYSSSSSSVGLYSKRKVHPENSSGYAQLRVAQILSAPSMALDLECLSPRSSRVKGTISLAADLVPHLAHDELLTFDVAFEKDAPAKKRITYVISRALPKGKWSPVYRSEVRTKDNEGLEHFRNAVLTNRELNSGNDRRLLRIEFYRAYNNRKTTLLGFCQTSLLSLRTCVLNAGLYWWPAQDGIPNARVVLTRRTVTEDSSTFVLRVVNASRKFNEN